MEYSKQQKKYIDSVDGDAHMSAVDIIGQLEGIISAQIRSFNYAIGLLTVAKCPNCDGSGVISHEVGGCSNDGENDSRECIIEQCQWCYERDQLIKESNVADAPRQQRKD